MESYDGQMLIHQIIEEQQPILESKGFQVDVLPIEQHFYMEVNLLAIRRIFDNLFSNVMKYGDPSTTIYNTLFCK